MSYKRFILAFSVSAIGLLVAFAAVVYLIDPYNLFGSTRHEGINQIRPASSSRPQVFKPYQVLRQQPRSLIVGNSRPEMGIDPNSKCWQREQKPVYNLGVPGSSFYQQYRLTQHAITGSRVRQIYFGLDFLDFLGKRSSSIDYANWPKPSPRTDQRLLIREDGSPNPEFAQDKLRDYREALFSLSGIYDAVMTLASNQLLQNAATRRSDGFNPARVYIDIIANEGQGVLFTQKNRELAKRLFGRSLTVYPAGDNWSVHFEALQRTLQMAEREEVDLVLFINPYHAQYIGLLDAAGLWAEFSNWKRRLTHIAAEHHVPLWDFSTFNTYSLEELPAKSRGQGMQWFWEPAHYKRELGEAMLATMLKNACANIEPNFAALMLPSRIEKHISDQTKKLRHFQQTNSHIWKNLKSLADNQLRPTPSNKQVLPE